MKQQAIFDASVDMRALTGILRSVAFSVIDVLFRLIAKITGWRFLVHRADRVGHQSRDIDHLARHDPNYRNYIFLIGATANDFLFDFYRRYIRIFRIGRLYPRLHQFCTRYPMNPLVRNLPAHHDDFTVPNDPVFKLSREDIERGYRKLAEHGIPRSARWVTIHARDASYLQTTFPGKDFSYHNFRDCTLANQKLAIQWLVDQGLYVFRMGKVSDQNVPIQHERVIDYANEFRSDFMDVFLMSECFFFMGPGTGLTNIGQVFTKRILIINSAPISCISWSPGGITMPKLYRDQRTGRLLNFSEIVANGSYNFGSSQLFEQAGIELIENTPEEILAAAQEAYGRYSGTWHSRDDYNQLLEAYHSHWPRGSRHAKANPRPLVPEAFLVAHRELFDEACARPEAVERNPVAAPV